VLEDHGKTMQDMKLIRTNGKKKIIFTVDGTRRQHEEIMASLRQSKDLGSFTAVGGPEID